MCCVGIYRKRIENTGVAWERIKKATQTQVLRGNLWKTQGKHMFRVGTYEKQGKHLCCVGAYQKKYENISFVLEQMENKMKTNVLRKYILKTY